MSNHSEEKYFNLHVTGCGYLQRARLLKPKGKGKPYLAVTVCALVGDASRDPNTGKSICERRYIDCIVKGTQAKLLVEQHMAEINDRNHSVFVTFRAGDIWADAFIRTKDATGPDGKKVGEPDASLKGRLLWIGVAKIDGQEIYRAPANEYHPDTEMAEE